MANNGMMPSTPGGAPVNSREMNLRLTRRHLGFGRLTGMDQVDYQGFKWADCIFASVFTNALLWKVRALPLLGAQKHSS